MATIYLETSFFSTCVSARTDARSVYWRETSNAWWEGSRFRHELFISDEVVAELSAPKFPQREDALRMLRDVPLLAITPEAIGFTEILIREKLMPAPLGGDAIHVATAAVHGVEYLLTWNVKHMANPNKRAHLGTVCLRYGLMPPLILTPEFFGEKE